MSLRALTVEGPAGRGGHGVVWKVRTAGHGVPLALKTLPPERAADGGRRSILENELQALARLRHPGVVRLLDAGVVEAGEARPELGLVPGTPWMLTEWIDGRSLQDAPPLRRWGLLRPVFEDVLAALAHLHARGLVHRDLSPSNVLWSWRDRRYKLIDLGLAQLAGAAPSRRAGTPGFVAPEVVTGGPVDGRADLFSLGRVAAGLTQDVGLVGCPVDQLARWWQALSAPDPDHRPWDAAMARALLDATLPPAPRHVQPAGAAPTPAVGRGQSPAPASAPTRTQTQTQDMTGVAAAGPDRSEPHPPRSVRVALPAAPPAPARVLALASRLPSASLFAHREPALVGRDEALQHLWSALLDAQEGPVVVALEAAPGLGSSGLLRALGARLREGGYAEVLGSPTARPQTRRLPVWLLEAADGAAAAHARSWDQPGLVVLGPGPAPAPPGARTVGLDPVPPKLWGALVRSFLPLDPVATGWVSLRASGAPGRVASVLQEALVEGWLRSPEEGRIGLTSSAPPPPEARVATEELVETADALGREEANEAAWYLLQEALRRPDFRATDGVEARAARLAVALSDRMPQAILPTALPPIPLPPRSDPAWWDAVAAQGVRARRRYDLDAARGHFATCLAAAETPAQASRAPFELGATEIVRGALSAAEAHFRAALSAAGDPGADRDLAIRAGHARVALCLVRCQQGAFAEALDHAAAARAIFTRLALPGPLANLPALESPCHLWLGDLDAAEATARASLAAYARRGSPARLVPLMNLAAVAHHRGQTELLRDLLEEVGRRAVVEEPRLLVVVGLYGVLLQAQGERDRDAARVHWAEHDAAWAHRPEWHPALGRMLWDLVEATEAAGWATLAAAARARLDAVRRQHGDTCLAAFGVPRPEPAGCGAIG